MTDKTNECPEYRVVKIVGNGWTFADGGLAPERETYTVILAWPAHPDWWRIIGFFHSEGRASDYAAAQNDKICAGAGVLQPEEQVHAPIDAPPDPWEQKVVQITEGTILVPVHNPSPAVGQIGNLEINRPDVDVRLGYPGMIVGVAAPEPDGARAAIDALSPLSRVTELEPSGAAAEVIAPEPVTSAPEATPEPAASDTETLPDAGAGVATGWTDEKIAILDANWGTKSATQIGAMIGMSNNAVKSKANRRGLTQRNNSVPPVKEGAPAGTELYENDP